MYACIYLSIYLSNARMYVGMQACTDLKRVRLQNCVHLTFEAAA